MNIVPLQNVVSNASGLDATAELSNSLANIQQMVNFSQKRIYTNYLGAYTPEASIQVLSPMNLCNVGITSNNIPITGSGSSGTIINSSSITSVSASTFINLYDTNQSQSPAISMGVLKRQIFKIDGMGNGLYYDASNIATEFRVSSMTFAADLAVISTVTVGGTCYAQNFVTLSDKEAKYDIEAIMDRSSIMSKFQTISPYTFSYKGSKAKEIGILAQELEGLFPECIDIENNTRYVKYNSVVSLLLGAVRSLSERVDDLESGLLSLQLRGNI